MVAQVGSTVWVTDSTTPLTGAAVTIPGGALGMLIFWGFDSATNGSTLSSVSCTGAGAFTIAQNVPTSSGGFERCAGVAYADVTSTGSKTFSTAFSAAIAQGAIYAIVFLDAAPIADSLVRGSGGDNTSGSAALAVSANSTATSLVLGFEAKYNAVPAAPSGWTSVGTGGPYNGEGARVSTADSPGASSTTFTAPAPDYSAAVVIALGLASAPTLSSPSGAATGNTTGSGSVSTTGADGTLWRKAATSAQTDPGAGNEAANGWSSTTVSASGVQNVTFTGLTTNTSHVANYLHVSAGGLRSAVATSATFAPPTMATSGSLSAQSGVVSSAFSWTGVTPESQIIQQGVGSSAWALTSAGGSGLTTINSSTGVPGGTLTATPGTYAVTVTKTDSSTAGTNPTGGGAPPQTIVRSITVTVSAGADTTPPTLSSASATGGVATCSGSVSTNEGNGTLYAVFCASATPPTAVQVEAGQDNAGAAALRAVSQAVSLSGAQTVAAGAISAGTRYAYFMHKDAAGNRSSVVASASITVTAGGVGSFNLNNAIYAFKRKDGVLLTSLGVTFFVNNHLTGDIIGTAITGLSTNASGIVTTPVSNASVVAGTTYRLSWRFSSGEYGQIEMQAA